MSFGGPLDRIFLVRVHAGLCVCVPHKLFPIRSQQYSILASYLLELRRNCEQHDAVRCSYVRVRQHIKPQEDEAHTLGGGT